MTLKRYSRRRKVIIDCWCMLDLTNRQGHPSPWWNKWLAGSGRNEGATTGQTFDKDHQFCHSLATEAEFLTQNPDKILKSFPPCYSKSPLQLCLEIFISSNSHNLLEFLQCVAVHCKGERKKIIWKPHPLPYGLRNPYRNLENSQDHAKNLKEIVRSWIRLQ